VNIAVHLHHLLQGHPGTRLGRVVVVVFRAGGHRTPALSSVRPDVSSGVAVWAHIGGFVAGLVLIKLLRIGNFVAKRDAIRHIEHPFHP